MSTKMKLKLKLKSTISFEELNGKTDYTVDIFKHSKREVIATIDGKKYELPNFETRSFLHVKSIELHYPDKEGGSDPSVDITLDFLE